MRIIDTSEKIKTAFNEGCFDLDRWKDYMDECLPYVKDLCLADMRESLGLGLSWDGDYLPVLNAVYAHPCFTEAVASFRNITSGLDEKIVKRFNRTVDADIVLYLGLCNGAGWVTKVKDRTVVLLGIEKILELGWQGIGDMNGLIIHELGHVYQEQYGVLRRETKELSDRFLWQLFTEGIAMVFEQETVGDPAYFHQDKDGWKDWCDSNCERIKLSFLEDLKTMTPEEQRWFGDWVDFEGHGDIGYYLGARFVRHILEHKRFDDVLSYDIDDVRRAFMDFTKAK